MVFHLFSLFGAGVHVNVAMCYNMPILYLFKSLFFKRCCINLEQQLSFNLMCVCTTWYHLHIWKTCLSGVYTILKRLKVRINISASVSLSQMETARQKKHKHSSLRCF